LILILIGLIAGLMYCNYTGKIDLKQDKLPRKKSEEDKRIDFDEPKAKGGEQEMKRTEDKPAEEGGNDDEEPERPSNKV